jgi:hypothetical protein
MILPLGGGHDFADTKPLRRLRSDRHRRPGAGPALSQQAAADGAVFRVAMTPAPLVAPSLAEPVLLCGNRWVEGTYVLRRNCLKACLNPHHSLDECRTKLVPLCNSCWRRLLACANDHNIPPALRCKVCSERYAHCMWPFLATR